MLGISWREDKRLIILSAFTISLFWMAMFVAVKFPDDGTLFQFYANWAGGFAGGLLTCLLPDKKDPPPGSTTIIKTGQEQTTVTPKLPTEPPKET